MRYLLILDLVLAALGGAMTIAVGFVALVYVVYGPTTPRMAAGLPGVATITACFLALGLLGLLAGVLLYRRKSFHWAAQFALFAALPLLAQIVLTHLRSP